MLTSDAVDAIQRRVEFEQVAGALLQVLSGAASLLSNLVFVVSLLLFMSLDSGGFVRGFRGLGGEHATVSSSMQRFVRGTRKYLVVATVFGAIVAAVDVALLYALGIPLPWLWGMLEFITSFIPNIWIRDRACSTCTLALLEGGPTRMLVLIAAYSLVNVLIQSVVQPRVAGNAGGLSATASSPSLVPG